MGTYVYDGVVPGWPSRLFGSKLLKIWFVRMSWKWIAHRSHRIFILGTLGCTQEFHYHILLPVFFSRITRKTIFTLHYSRKHLLLKTKKTFNSFVVFLFLFQVTGISMIFRNVRNIHIYFVTDERTKKMV